MRVTEVPEGTTAALLFQLRNVTVDPNTLEETEAPFDGTGMTLEIVMKDRNGVDVSPTIDWEDATISKVRVSPAEGDLLQSGSPYRVRFKITDATGKVFFYPTTKEPDSWIVGAPA